MADLPKHLFIGYPGNLYDTRVPEWHKQAPLRPNYQYTAREIKTVSQLKATLRAGPYAWPGGYPLYFLCSDGEALSFKTVRKEFKLIARAIKHTDNTGGWRVVGCDVNYEKADLYDAHTNEKIEAAYV